MPLHDIGDPAQKSRRLDLTHESSKISAVPLDALFHNPVVTHGGEARSHGKPINSQGSAVTSFFISAVAVADRNRRCDNAIDDSGAKKYCRS